ncbi:uncharacterized protein EAE98_012192 [Botrytis deweyae]|uniref:Hydrophobin n=2 Tax=Botrytis TaxID=33196 RepID=A0A4Z1JLD3_9HELO|nr:uncharacterized protein EAE98_012192 [Botrytis deweyae]KAF7910237.1 hypothetical protein EAE98_012192 [Botrytis deweyae]KAF7934599.1 hypothetical protein EAE99_003049 [Botrytis elliptica]TGO74124.1 hypothetical protein BELL_0306g00080 [Botrytis elliptica]
MQFSILTLVPLLTLATAAPTTTRSRASLVQTCVKADLGKSCNAGFISGVAAIGLCTSTVINVESGIFACSVETTSTATSPRASTSVYGDAATDKGKHLKDLRRIVERGFLLF